MPPELFEEWHTLYEMEPWADERADYAAGISIMHNVASHGVNPQSPVEYMPFLVQPKPKQQTDRDMKAAWYAICTMREGSPELEPDQ